MGDKGLQGSEILEIITEVIIIITLITYAVAIIQRLRLGKNGVTFSMARALVFLAGVFAADLLFTIMVLTSTMQYSLYLVMVQLLDVGAKIGFAVTMLVMLEVIKIEVRQPYKKITDTREDLFNFKRPDYLKKREEDK